MAGSGSGTCRRRWGRISTPLLPGTVYRVGLHQRRGTGSNAVLEAFLAPAGTAFGAPFASLATGTWTTSADRLRFGATSGSAIDATADNIALDAGATPAPATASLAGRGDPRVDDRVPRGDRRDQRAGRLQLHAPCSPQTRTSRCR